MQILTDNGPKIKRLLEFNAENLDVTSAMACRNALFPVVLKDQRGGSNNRFPSWAVDKCFKAVSFFLKPFIKR